MLRFEVTEDAVLVWDLHTHVLMGGAAYLICGDAIEIINLHLDEEFRGNGVGSRLIEFIADHFRKDISLGVMIENKDAQRFYQRLGFKFVRKIRTGPALLLVRKQGTKRR